MIDKWLRELTNRVRTAVEGVTAPTWLTGASQRSLADMPYVKTNLHVFKTPMIDMKTGMAIAVVSISNLRTDSDVVQAAEITTPPNIAIYRFRPGKDGAWTSVTGGAMSAFAGYASYAYRYPYTEWEPGDRIWVRTYGGVVTIAGQTFALPDLYESAEIGRYGSMHPTRDTMVLDSFEQYTNTAAMTGVWSDDTGNTTFALETTSPLYGSRSLKATIGAGNTGEAYRAVDPLLLGTPYPRGRLMGCAFLAKASTGTPTIRVTLEDASDAGNNYKYWEVALDTQDRYYCVDFRETAGATGGAWDSTLIDQLNFAHLEGGGSGCDFYIDNVVFLVDVPLTENLSNYLASGFISSGITVNDDGSVIEREEGLLQRQILQNLVLLAVRDDFDVADADADNERWDAGYLSGAEGGSADIDTTVSDKLYVAVEPDATPTAADYGANLAQPLVSKYWSAIVDVDVVSFGTPNTSWATIGMRISPTTYDGNNIVYCQRQSSSGGVGNRIAVGANFNGVNQGEQYYTTTDEALAFKIERADNIWRCYYSLSQYPDYVWVLLAEYEDPSEFMDSQQSVYLDAYSPGNADTQDAIGTFSHFKVLEAQTGILQALAGDYDSTAVTSDADGSVIEREEYIQTQLGYGVVEIEEDTGGSQTVITDASVLTEGANFWRGCLLVCISGNNAGQARPVRSFAAGALTVYPAFDNVVAIGDDLLLISGWRTKAWDQQADVAVTTTAPNGGEADIFDLSTAGFSYMVNSLRLKSADPGANSVTVRLYELINDVSIAVDTFTIDSTNWGTYFSLVDMFGLQHLAGDDLHVTVQGNGAAIGVTGQYQYALTPSW